MLKSEKVNSEFSALFVKYMKGTCSFEEAQHVIGVLENPHNDEQILDEISGQWDKWQAVENNEELKFAHKVTMDRILDRLHHKIRLQEDEDLRDNSKRKTIVSVFIKFAAILIIPLFIYSAYLTATVFKAKSEKSSQTIWQTIKTPAGIQTDFALPDGSHVWLNSGSVFKYPVSFAEDKRQVELNGEAYFDVAKDASHPFLVKAGKMNIEVKGTRFDVISYPDEVLTELILVSGSVRLFSGKYEDNKTITNIKPGECAALNAAKNKLIISKVDIAKYTAWKEGLLIFRDDPMNEVVRKLNRWFNVEIILQSPELKEYVYTATYKDETLPQILELLKISAPVKYNITERKRLGDNSYSKRKIIITKRR